MVHKKSPRIRPRRKSKKPLKPPRPPRPPEKHEAKTALQRLQKVIARAGITSRRKAEEMILEGRVKVNRKAVSTMGIKVDPDSDIVEVDGRRIAARPGLALYILINKPRGVISALSDPQKRPVVTALLKRIKTRVWPVGRLDYDAEGALLLTNDGDLGNRLLHPRYAVPKRYLIKVRGVPGESKLKKLERGVRLEDGRTLPCSVRLSRVTKENSWLELVVYEGRNRLVKRMCKAIGHPVTKLKRLEFAGLKVRGMKPGEYRTLTKKELERLRGFNPTNEKK